MLRSPATLGQLMETFKPLADGAGVVFHTDEGEIGAGYHVTELKLAHFDSTDFGGNRHRLVGSPSAAARRAGVRPHARRQVHRHSAQKCLETIDELRDVPVYVEFALENCGIERFRIEDIEVDGNHIAIALEPGNAACKPALALMAKRNGLAYCGSGAEAAACSC